MQKFLTDRWTDNTCSGGPFLARLIPFFVDCSSVFLYLALKNMPSFLQERNSIEHIKLLQYNQYPMNSITDDTFFRMMV